MQVLFLQMTLEDQQKFSRNVLMLPYTRIPLLADQESVVDDDPQDEA